jgi:hypothetical protein
MGRSALTSRKMPGQQVSPNPQDEIDTAVSYLIVYAAVATALFV